MALHNLTRPEARSNRKRVGRGNGNNWGRTCGRGEKGQKSRSGYSFKSHFEGGQIPFIRRIPKRGFKNPNTIEYALINVRDLEANFEAGEEITIETLQSRGLVNKAKAGLKVLGDGDISKALTISAVAVSKSAQAKMEAAGGSIVIISPVASAEAPVEAEAETEESGSE